MCTIFSRFVSAGGPAADLATTALGRPTLFLTVARQDLIDLASRSENSGTSTTYLM